MRFLTGVLTVLAVLAVSTAAIVFGGFYNVAAVDSLPAPVAWAIHRTMKTSVAARAKDVAVPKDLSSMASEGFDDFNEMCVQCHGAPGKDAGEIGKGLMPRPPSLVDASKRWMPSEIFWIVKNGVHMTGMPAFGPTHDDARIWAIVAFVNRLGSLSTEDYAKLEKPEQEQPKTHDDAAPHHHHHD